MKGLALRVPSLAQNDKRVVALIVFLLPRFMRHDVSPDPGGAARGSGKRAGSFSSEGIPAKFSFVVGSILQDYITGL